MYSRRRVKRKNKRTKTNKNKHTLRRNVGGGEKVKTRLVKSLREEINNSRITADEIKKNADTVWGIMGDKFAIGDSPITLSQIKKLNNITKKGSTIPLLQTSDDKIINDIKADDTFSKFSILYNAVFKNDINYPYNGRDHYNYYDYTIREYSEFGISKIMTDENLPPLVLFIFDFLKKYYSKLDLAGPFEPHYLSYRYLNILTRFRDLTSHFIFDIIKQNNTIDDSNKIINKYITSYNKFILFNSNVDDNIINMIFFILLEKFKLYHDNTYKDGGIILNDNEEVYANFIIYLLPLYNESLHEALNECIDKYKSKIISIFK